MSWIDRFVSRLTGIPTDAEFQTTEVSAPNTGTVAGALGVAPAVVILAPAMIPAGGAAIDAARIAKAAEGGWDTFRHKATEVRVLGVYHPGVVRFTDENGNRIRFDDGAYIIKPSGQGRKAVARAAFEAEWEPVR